MTEDKKGREFRAPFLFWTQDEQTRHARFPGPASARRRCRRRRAQLFGPSDEAKAHEAAQDTQLTTLAGENQQLAARIQAQEDKTRSLTETLAQATGNNEELRHQIDLLNQKIDQQEKDFSYRLCMVSAQQLGAGTDDQGLNCAGTGAGSNAAPRPRPSLQPGAALPPIGAPHRRRQPASPPPARPHPAGAASRQSGHAFFPGDRGRAAGGNQFDAAMALLGKAQYDEAKASFRAYADANPDDSDLAPQAIYWVGSIDYTQHDYPERDDRLRRTDQEISQIAARSGQYVEAGPVAAGDGPDPGRLHHPWRDQEQIPASPRRDPHARGRHAQSLLQPLSCDGFRRAQWRTCHGPAPWRCPAAAIPWR